MKLLTKRTEKNHMKMQKHAIIVRKILKDKYSKDKKYIVKLETIIIIQVNLEVLHITYVIIIKYT